MLARNISLTRRTPWRRNKYNARKVTMPNGKIGGSELERQFFLRLSFYRDAGKIASFDPQNSVVVAAGNGESVTWLVDFKVNLLSGQELWVETKGYQTADYAIKRKLFIINDIGPLVVLKGKMRQGEYSYYADKDKSHRMYEIECDLFHY